MSRWRLITALATLAALVVATVIWYARLGPDFWPPDESRVGPNLIASLIQTAVVLIIVVLIWPPFRRRADRFIKSHTEPIRVHLERLHAQRQAHHEEQMRKLEEIHRHVKKEAT